MNWKAFVFCLSCCLASYARADVAAASPQTKPPFSITGMLTVDQFHACGLDKLTPAEHAKLDDFLLEKFADALDRRNAAADLVESEINGEFNGWSGDTVFQLVNGQVWQQSTPSIYVGIAIMPHVLIYKSRMGGYKMKVDNVEQEVAVTRIK